MRGQVAWGKTELQAVLKGKTAGIAAIEALAASQKAVEVSYLFRDTLHDVVVVDGSTQCSGNNGRR